MRLYGLPGTYRIKKYWVMIPGSPGGYLYEVTFNPKSDVTFEISLQDGFKTIGAAEAYVNGHSQECEVKSITFPKKDNYPDEPFVPITKLSDIR